MLAIGSWKPIWQPASHRIVDNDQGVDNVMEEAANITFGPTVCEVFAIMLMFFSFIYYLINLCLVYSLTVVNINIDFS